MLKVRAERPQLPLVLAIVLATVLFAFGAAFEKSDTHDESSADITAEASTGHEEGEASEDAEAHSETASPEGATEAGEEHGSEDETLLGIDLESTPLVVLAVIGSLLLAVAVFIRPDLAALFGLIAIAMLAFALLDVREVVHQLDESEEGLAALAAAVAAAHLTAGLLALARWRVAGAAAASA